MLTEVRSVVVFPCIAFALVACQTLPDTVPEVTNPYQRGALLTQALAAVAPLRVSMTEYAMVEGHYPDSLEELGLVEAQMRDSQYFRELYLAEGGRIKVLVDARLGARATLELAPKTVMGGMSTEWQCRTNVPDTTQVDTCQYDRRLKFD